MLKKKMQKAAQSSLLAFVSAAKNEKLTILKVYNTLARIATVTGEGSRDIKLKLLAGLLTDAEPKRG